MIFFYNIFIFLYRLIALLLSGRKAKAAEWIAGRKNLFAQLEQQLTANTAPIIWVHAASTGEFEQAKPVIEAVRSHFPRYKILATFFSPSGYRAAENYTHIDYRYYLPEDTAANAKRFLSLADPTLVIFSKYDFWHHHIKAIAAQKIPLLLISAIFRPDQLFFKWYGGFYRRILRRFTHVFVQDATSVGLLQGLGGVPCSLSGDTRFDRVLALPGGTPLPHIERFAGNDAVLVAGSTWPGDEALLQTIGSPLKLIIAPHEISAAHLTSLQTVFSGALLYSQWIKEQKQTTAVTTLIIDNVGMLARLYQYATICYIGGGFTRDGIHNTLEAAVWHKPVLFGPNYKKYREAKELIESGGGFSIGNARALQQQLDDLLKNTAAYEAAAQAAGNYVAEQAGATARILRYIQEKRLLTN